jgi:hypothetical protein
MLIHGKKNTEMYLTETPNFMRNKHARTPVWTIDIPRAIIYGSYQNELSLQEKTNPFL